jgi:hypothetical protein
MNPALIGSSVLTLFGAVWFAMGGIFGGLTYGPPLLILVGAPFIVLVVLIGRTNRFPTARPYRGLPKGGSGAFAVINALQFVAIVIAIAIAIRFKRDDLIPAIIEAIVGLHFLPLARVFRARAQFIVGVSMLAGSAFAFALHGSLAVAVACVSAGTILWIAALSILIVARKRSQSAIR